jgi:Ca2+-binding RTX toxin-like protein
MPTIIGTAASELLEGGPDADYIRDDAGGSDILRGNGGNDTLIVYRRRDTPAGTVRMEGGDGDDSLSYRGSNASDVIMDGGSGADRFLLQNAGGGVSITTGSGVDTIELDQRYTNSAGQFTPSIIVTDFSTGPGGDRLDWSSFLALHLYSWTGSNPFALGHARLLQSGGDTLLQFDSNGGGTAYVTLATFQNTIAASFTAENLGGFPPDGSIVPGQIITGTAGDETLNGTGGNDVISGFDGNDIIYGGAGNDQIEGGAGADTLYGGVGSDIVSGGDGNDVLADRENGSDILLGNGGNDTLTVSRAGQMVDAIIHMEGGDGDDSLSYESLSSGAERIEVIMDGGSGADRLIVLGSHSNLSITTGSGVDTIEIYRAQVNRYGQMTAIVVTDFSTGAGGDRLDWSRYLTLASGDGGDPFASGHARLLQSGADTLLQFDTYGGSNVNITFVTFRNTTATSFTAENLGGFVPEVGQIITGTAGAETLNGTAGNDVIRGWGGNDIIDGAAGDDLILGGTGHNIIDGGAGWDIVTVSGPASAYRLLGDGDNFILKGPDGGDRLTNVEAIRFADGKILDLARMYGPDVDARAWADGRIPEALLSLGTSGDERPLVLPGPAGDAPLTAKDGPKPEVLPLPDDGGGWAWEHDEGPLVLPGVEDWPPTGSKSFDLFEVLPEPDGGTLIPLDRAALLDRWSDPILIADEQGLVSDHHARGGGGSDGWSF